MADEHKPIPIPTMQRLSQPAESKAESRQVEGRESREEEKQKLHEQVVSRLKQFGNKEAEIPLNDQYWTLLNKFRSL